MEKPDKKRPFVGLGVIVLKNDLVLMGKRKGSLGAGSWGFPGGCLEYGEELDYCALRGLKEEVNSLQANLIDRYAVATTNDYFESEKEHYVTLYLRALYKAGSPELLPPKEPDKCEKWEWFKWDDLRRGDIHPIFLPIKNLLMQEFNPFEKLIDEDSNYRIDLSKPRRASRPFTDFHRSVKDLKPASRINKQLN